MDVLPRAFKKKLKASGIMLGVFNPFMPVINKFMSYRDHRKITVIDGNVGFTGGINIGDEYINLKKLHGYWKDTSIMLRGDAVWNFTVMFLDLWILITDDNIEYDRYRPTLNLEVDGYIQPFEDSPLNYSNVAEGTYMQLINCAKKYVYISTPYLILDNEMTIALCNAAKSGIDVRIITPHIPDKWYVHIVTRSNYQRLLECGVKIFEYIPGFIHAKVFLCDDEAAVVGSVNMDYRSFYLQFESAVWIYKNSVIKEIKDDFALTLRKSLLIDIEEWSRRPAYIKFLEILLRLFAPLM
jgi:cardiolipin synthase